MMHLGDFVLQQVQLHPELAGVEAPEVVREDLVKNRKKVSPKVKGFQATKPPLSKEF